jgi:hypothetical protein
MPPHPTSWRSILYNPSIYAWVFQVAPFPQVPPPNPCIQLSSTPHMLHALPIQSRFEAYVSVPYKASFCLRSCYRILQTPNYMTTPCRLSATPYSIYSQLPSILEAVPPSATWRRTIAWWQGPMFYPGLCACKQDLFTEKCKNLTNWDINVVVAWSALYSRKSDRCRIQQQPKMQVCLYPLFALTFSCNYFILNFIVKFAIIQSKFIWIFIFLYFTLYLPHFVCGKSLPVAS